jgi:hypothetical protein
MLAAEEDGGKPSCVIQNLTVDNASCSLDSWRRGMVVGHVWVPGTEVTSTSSKNHWRVPTSGIARFDFVAFTPCFVNMEHFQLDLNSCVQLWARQTACWKCGARGVREVTHSCRYVTTAGCRDADKLIAKKLWVQMVRNPGESWWNTKVDTFPVAIKEDDRGYGLVERRCLCRALSAGVPASHDLFVHCAFSGPLVCAVDCTSPTHSLVHVQFSRAAEQRHIALRLHPCSPARAGKTLQADLVFA